MLRKPLQGIVLLKSASLVFSVLFFSSIVFAQSISVGGKVLSSKESGPLAGVSVTIKGSPEGTTTDDKGNFQISVPGSTAILVFSYQGYLSQEITVANRTSFTIGLEENIKKLDEVIVVGYGQQKRRDVTGAISSVASNALREVPVNSPGQALQGRVAGLYAVTQGYSPGADVTIRIRGNRSFSAGNDPLYVVDGIPISGGLNDINPNDIESMEVLKDASATAIYGSRGANGVILITTRRGKTGAPTVTYDAYIGVVKTLGTADIFNGAEFAEYKRESRRTSGKYKDSNKDSSDKALFEPVELKSIEQGRYTDYQDLMLEDGVQQSHQLGVYGGGEQTKYGISIGYFNDKGVVPVQDFTRYTLRLNIDQQIGKRIKVGSSVLGTYSTRNGANLNPIDDALAENPLGVPYDSAGNLIFLPTTDGLRTNPLSELVKGAQVDKNKRFRLFASLYGEIEILKGLKYRINFGPDIIQNRNGRYIGQFTNDRRGGDPTASTSEDFVFAYTLENIITYNKTFNRKHALNFTGLYGVQTREQEGTNNGVQNVPIQDMQYYNLGAAPIITGVGSFFEKWTILSYMARINYVFNDKYLLTVTGRSDGSSRFASGQKWGFFPSVAIGWNMANENFLSNSNIISNLKLRASYGETANTGINPYQTLGGLGRTTYAFDNTAAYGYRPVTIPNPSLKWESTGSFNAGIDFGFFNNRITGSVEVYRQNTHDLLMQRQLPITGGYGSILENIGSTRNTGYEVTISTVNIKHKNTEGGFSWSTDLNFFQNKEEIVELFGGKKDDIGNGWFIGQPLSVIYDYEKIGIWQTAEKNAAQLFSQKPGQIKIKDQNSDGFINASDRVILGSNVPKFSGGITNRFSYKGFDLAIFIFARFGNKITSGFHNGAWMQLQGRYNNLKVDYWTETNPTNNYPRPDENSERPIYNSTLQYFDGSFIKIRNINIGYNLPERFVNKIGIKGLRFYASAQQPLIFAPYRQKEKGIDPEYPTANTPATSMYSFGFNAKF
ncbi:SusC/RagA family TonB-linked outer membrane protein [Terrimonas alba]|uniref:SusC/RagA family TonB-linked outer membrane protein n=1 Tax=Terrimonas alba TaxID=3349636 RepID=UPI0035F4DA9C